MIKKSTLFSETFTAFVILFLLAILSFGGGYGYAVTNGIKLWFALIVPSLFPCLFLTAAIANLNFIKKATVNAYPVSVKLFNTSGITIYAFIMSIICGYPIGSKIVADLKTANLIDKTEAERAAAFCSSPSPAFVLTAVGKTMFLNKTFGYILFVSGFLSAVLNGFVFSFYKKKDDPKKRTPFLLIKK